MKRALKALATILLAMIYALYLISGVALSYRKQPEISREYPSAFRAFGCYGDTVSCDRARIIEDNKETLLNTYTDSLSITAIYANFTTYLNDCSSL